MILAQGCRNTVRPTAGKVSMGKASRKGRKNREERRRNQKVSRTELIHFASVRSNVPGECRIGCGALSRTDDYSHLTLTRGSFAGRAKQPRAIFVKPALGFSEQKEAVVRRSTRYRVCSTLSYTDHAFTGACKRARNCANAGIGFRGRFPSGPQSKPSPAPPTFRHAGAGDLGDDTRGATSCGRSTPGYSLSSFQDFRFGSRRSGGAGGN
jgi:hypothetical protein